jgi:hypothetical protein
LDLFIYFNAGESVTIYLQIPCEVCTGIFSARAVAEVLTGEARAGLLNAAANLERVHTLADKGKAASILEGMLLEALQTLVEQRMAEKFGAYSEEKRILVDAIVTKANALYAEAVAEAVKEAENPDLPFAGLFFEQKPAEA